jgi:phospholipid N-methyltransferase
LDGERKGDCFGLGMSDLFATRDWTATDCPGGSREQASAWEAPKDSTLVDYWQFFSSFLRNPASVGALVPSSVSLAREVIAGCDLENAEVVVELGPGTGVITREILRRINPKATFLALELDATNAAKLQRRHDGVRIYNESAEHIRRCLNRQGRKRADYIISALPWGNMGCKLQDRILRSVFGTLSEQGKFTTFAYVHTRWLPTAHHFRQRLRKHFAEIATSKVVWKNLPPAFVYRCS